MIKNMGLFWKREDVNFGAKGKGKKGSLSGKLSTAKKSGDVDFWEQVGIYALYADYRLVYIGQTGGKGNRLGSRLRQHTQDDLAGRWDSFSWFGFSIVKKNNTLTDPPRNKQNNLSNILNIMEGVVIAVAEPPLNRQGGRFKDVERYLHVSVLQPRKLGSG
ncbi:MAG: GIY-YIG nuclease family protein [Deltaproteobacteria bacterium]|nr:GIY-YIG nuclease family protein [Deltaproteobacteria bacterium]